MRRLAKGSHVAPSLPDNMIGLCANLHAYIEARAQAAHMVELRHEACEIRRAQVLLDEGAVNGKNEAQRSAQLLLALYNDEEYQEAVMALSKAKGDLATADADLEACRAHISLLRAYLLSQASQTVME
jgi:hypothetical protein